MKIFLHLCLLVSLLYSAEVQFSFYEHTSQRFEIPFDTTFREYKAPIDLIETGQTPILRMIFNGCGNREFHIDNIRFPSNAYIDFEDGLPELTLSPGISQALLVEHPSDSGFVLHIEFDSNHHGRDTLRIAQPDSWYPVVPESFGLEFQADVSNQLTKYFKPPELARYDVNVDDWSYRTVLAEKYNETTTIDSSIFTLKRRHFPGEGSHEVYVFNQTYKYSNYHPNLLHLDEMGFDFEAPLNEYVSDDSSWGSWLVFEQYQEVFGEIVFVKKMTTTGLIGYNLHFAYGVGLIREDFPGTSVHADLVGIQDQGETLMGDMNLPISLSLSSSFERWGSTVFPPDTNWYHYNIPVNELFGYDSVPTTVDSLFLSLAPGIHVRYHDSGRLLFYGLSLWEEENLVFDYGALEHGDWLLNPATNGSEMEWQDSQDLPPGGVGNSSLLYFANEWEWGDYFAGFAEYTTHFSQPIVVDNSHLRFWMKQPLIMTDIDEYTIVVPEEMGVLNAYPNPFNGEVTLIIGLAEDSGQQELLIYDIRGRRIKSIQFEDTQPLHQISWKGDDQNGHFVESGVYLATLSSESQPVGQIQKIIMLK
ncbi:MAG: T9SS type A sorting domain-containing protein [FCB group bacterium]|nr:T9SS type A sorting domain-containing protein [FCB group bacterium]MBL7028885.1 T9SS type A sorting domain-containing protein [Candidatus Neomarinimicrobiota bacterium]MBL7122723.1 T9SS type A sorting domain-containing protein [Candidatus Neomarinimicrobiota bacterium]